MKVFAVLLVVLSLCASASISQAKNTASQEQCIYGCLPGDNPCQTCCEATFSPCHDGCRSAFVVCDRKCSYNNYDCRMACKAVFDKCRFRCYRSTPRVIDCPDWVQEEKCSFDCQVWSPLERKCVGAEMNGCSGN